MPARDRALVHDRERSIISIQNGPVTVYLLPADIEFTAENASDTTVY